MTFLTVINNSIISSYFIEIIIFRFALSGIPIKKGNKETNL